MFTIRDLCWLITLVAVGLGAYLRGDDNGAQRLADDIWQRGYYDGRKWEAVMFPIRNEAGRYDGRQMRVFTRQESAGCGTKMLIVEVLCPKTGWKSACLTLPQVSP